VLAVYNVLDGARRGKVIFAAICLTACLGAKAGPFINGGFEIIKHAPIPDRGSVFINPGDTWLTGWTVGGPGGDCIAVGHGLINGLLPHEGQLWIGFNGADKQPGGTLSQTFSTAIGNFYTVIFAVGQVGFGNVSLTASALAPDKSVLASKCCIPTTGVWTDFQITFTAVSTNTTLIFKDSSPQTIAVDVALDDVRVYEDED
jgi:hypothetical protein